MMSLVACSPKAQVHTASTIPASLTAPTVETPVPIRVNGDLTLAIRSLRKDLGFCNADKASILEFQKLIQ